MDWFGVIWLAVIAFMAYWNWAWFWRAHKTGVATVYARFEISKSEKPFEFKMIQIGRIAGMFVAIAMLVFGFQFMLRI